MDMTEHPTAAYMRGIMARIHAASALAESIHAARVAAHQEEARMHATEIHTPAAPRPTPPTRPDMAPGRFVAEPPGYARRTRLNLDPRIRAKLERIEAQAAAARAEVLRLGELLDGERQREVEFAQTERTWAANYHRDVTPA